MTIHRRTLLKSSAPLLAAAIATGALCEGLPARENKPPVQRRCDKWVGMANQYGALLDKAQVMVDVPAELEEAIELACDRVGDVEANLMRLPAQDLRDIAIKARIAARTDGVIDDEFNAQIRDDADRLLGHVNI